MKESGWWELKERGWMQCPPWKTEERGKGMTWSDARGDPKRENERKGYRVMAGCCQKQSLQSPPPPSYCLLQCDVLQGGEWIMTQDRAQAHNMPAWKTLAKSWRGVKRKRRGWNKRMKEKGGRRRETLKSLKRNMSSHTFSYFTCWTLTTVKHVFVCMFE